MRNDDDDYTDDLLICAHCDSPFSEYETGAEDYRRFCCRDCEREDDYENREDDDHANA